jgi:hypothetical protein
MKPRSSRDRRACRSTSDHAAWRAVEGMATTMEVLSLPVTVEGSDVLRRAVAGYLTGYKGLSRSHTESDLRVFLRWCTERPGAPRVRCCATSEGYGWTATPTRAPRCATTAPATSATDTPTTHVAELSLPGTRTDVTRTLRVAPFEREHADHRSVEIDHEKAGAPPGHLRHRALELVLSTHSRRPTADGRRQVLSDVGVRGCNAPVPAALGRPLGCSDDERHDRRDRGGYSGAGQLVELQR